MRKLILLPILLVLVSGCVQEQPTGKFLTNQVSGQDCVSSWSCGDWSVCARVDSISGLQSRTCTDTKACQLESAKPEESRICGLPGVSMADPSQMILNSSDLPKGGKWNVTSSGILPPQNVTDNERSLGYIEGYYSNFNGAGSVKAYNRIGIYPMVDSNINMTFDIDAAKAYYKAGSFYENTNMRILSFSELPAPLAEDYSIAYNITMTDSLGSVETAYTVCFTKLDVADVVTMRGRQPDYSELVVLAKKAQAKIV